ncbi:CGNR zinc finger domain-containing protein [Prauserella halophila]|nr:CGNR zinc finger domain-containing protein [Prauserella halophila]
MAAERNHCSRYTGDVDADVSLVLDFLNTVDVESDTDVLHSTAEWHAWAHARDLTPGSLDEAARARRVLRDAAGAPPDESSATDPENTTLSENTAPSESTAPSERTAPSENPPPSETPAPSARDLPIPVDVAFRLSPSADPQLVADDAVSAVFTAAMRLTVLGDWRRIKICPAGDCLWAFYDESRNRSRTWCSMQVCGNRVKARTFRRRTDSAGNEDSTVG